MAISFVGSTTWQGSAINGNNITITMSSLAAGDYVVVAVGIGSTRSPAVTATTSAGTSYTSLITTLRSSSINFGVFGRLISDPANETQILCTGTGGSSDSMTAVVLAFRGVSQTATINPTPTSTTGSGTTPDSPLITFASANCAIVSAVSAQINDTTVTAPTSFLNQNDDTSNDTWDTTTGIAWITNTSTSDFNPTSWTNFTSATWASATISIQPLVITPTPPLAWQEPDLGRIEIVAY